MEIDKLTALNGVISAQMEIKVTISNRQCVDEKNSLL